jgi:trans-aconitate methyltransferase
LLSYEVAYLQAAAAAPGAILDLGSGAGELSRALCTPVTKLDAVDFTEAYRKYFVKPDQVFHLSSVLSFEPTRQYDLVLLFGVCTYLSEDEELRMLKRLPSFLNPGGVAVVKNQCSTGETINYSGWSEDLNAEYISRYPSVEGQEARLRANFKSVRTLTYPSRFQRWPDTEHVGFVCG